MPECKKKPKVRGQSYSRKLFWYMKQAVVVESKIGAWTKVEPRPKIRARNN
jgi:hypothetical protein